MLTIIICSVVSFILGFGVSNLVGTNSKTVNNSKNPAGRRGLHSTTLTVGGKGEVDVLYEIREIDSTTNKSKIKVESYSCSRASFNGKESIYYKDIINLKDNSWIDHSEIEWIDNTSENRSRKIDQILN